MYPQQFCGMDYGTWHKKNIYCTTCTKSVIKDYEIDVTWRYLVKWGLEWMNEWFQ